MSTEGVRLPVNSAHNVPQNGLTCCKTQAFREGSYRRTGGLPICNEDAEIRSSQRTYRFRHYIALES